MAADARLGGRTALVTGALGKLGPALCDALAGAGARVIGLDAREGADEVADVTDRASLDMVRERVGRVDVLVNAAGIDQPPEAAARTYLPQDVPSEDFRRTVDVNLTGTFHAIQAFGPPMVEAGSGSIVNVGSLYASVAPDPTFYEHMASDPPFLKPAAYGASKAAVVNLTKYFARLWGPSGVRVNVLSPGGVAGGQDEEFLARYCARVPMGRMAELDDLAGPLLFLASDDSRYVTGQELRVDGGFTA